MIESTKYRTKDNVYLDISPDDLSSELFFKAQGQKNKKYRRLFVHDDLGVLKGASLGIGRAVTPAHSVKSNTSVRIIEGYKPLNIPVILHYRKQAYYTKLHHAIRDLLVKNCPGYLT